MLESGRLGLASLITHTVSIGQLPEALELLRRGQAIKIVVVPD